MSSLVSRRPLLPVAPKCEDILNALDEGVVFEVWVIYVHVVAETRGCHAVTFTKLVRARVSFVCNRNVSVHSDDVTIQNTSN